MPVCVELNVFSPQQFVYKRVIDETIKNSRETFLNEGIEESVLQELRTVS